ncbi:NAD(P)/FAD-dependent oxidoreductase [Ornithinicoccus halotolerans]|uniref:NAD(P)/FAD-dependent oxidoreductase n=1 Tax=Ornithinicoccus halotolerans TaxID=1748220 RepID=UPI001E2D5CB2|nr:FAD-dependent oxidoreductase [Ornithinicoccus halotolerans]
MNANLTGRHRSLWLREAVTGQPQPPLSGHHGTDVAIIGGGFVGLWTALRIKHLDPSVRVTILEADICGGGASGRNGGLVLSWWPKIWSLMRLFGEQEAVRLVQSTEQAITELESFCDNHAPEAEFRRAGWLWTATSPAHLDSWERVAQVSDRLGTGTFTPMTPGQVATRSGSPVHLGGVLDRSAASVHPGHLVRAMRRAALAMGVEIFEGTRVRHLARRGAPTVRTQGGGSVRAQRVVIATNAWAAGMRELHTRLFVISSDMIVTEPVPDRLEEIGWREGPTVTDSQTLLCYYRTTNSGRIAFGKGGWTIGLGGRISPSMDRNPRRARAVIRDFRRYYPMLRDVPIVNDWAGPIDRTHNSLPLINWLNPGHTIAYGVGWSGNGVGPSIIGGKVLASMVLGRGDEWGRSVLINAPTRHFPPDPIRFVGAHVVREALIRKERSEALGIEPSWVSKTLSKLAPAGLEDKNEAPPPGAQHRS